MLKDLAVAVDDDGHGDDADGIPMIEDLPMIDAGAIEAEGVALNC